MAYHKWSKEYDFCAGTDIKLYKRYKCQKCGLHKIVDANKKTKSWEFGNSWYYKNDNDDLSRLAGECHGK